MRESVAVMMARARVPGAAGGVLDSTARTMCDSEIVFTEVKEPTSELAIEALAVK